MCLSTESFFFMNTSQIPANIRHFHKDVADTPLFYWTAPWAWRFCSCYFSISNRHSSWEENKMADLSEVLKSLFAFFMKEKSLGKPMHVNHVTKRLEVATGLTSGTVYRLLHSREVYTPTPLWIRPWTRLGINDICSLININRILEFQVDVPLSGG